MSLENTKQLGAGGAGMQGDGPGSAAAIMKELQGLNVTVLTGAGASTKIDVAAIRSDDTVLSVVESAAGVLTDRTANTTIASLFASGTLTAATIVAGSSVTVAGKVYTFQAGAPVTYGQVQVGATDNDSIANLAAAINAYETSIERGGKTVVASAATNVCTITAAVEGAAGNAIAISSADATVVASGATLAGGSDTGGILIDVDTTGDSLLLHWYNKQ